MPLAKFATYLLLGKIESPVVEVLFFLLHPCFEALNNIDLKIKLC